MCFLEQTTGPGFNGIKEQETASKITKANRQFEFETNKVNYMKNNMITLKAIKTYLQSISLLPIAIVISIAKLFQSTFLAIEKKPSAC